MVLTSIFNEDSWLSPFQRPHTGTLVHIILFNVTKPLFPVDRIRGTDTSSTIRTCSHEYFGGWLDFILSYTCSICYQISPCLFFLKTWNCWRIFSWNYHTLSLPKVKLVWTQDASCILHSLVSTFLYSLKQQL